MARQAPSKRADAKATGVAFRKANKRTRDDEVRPSKGMPGPKRQRQDAASAKKVSKAEAEKSEPKKPIRSKPFKGDKLAKKPAQGKKPVVGKNPAPETAVPKSAASTGKTAATQKGTPKAPRSAAAPVAPVPAETDKAAHKAKAKPVTAPRPKNKVTDQVSNKLMHGMRIVAGSYERFLYGLAAFMRINEEGEYSCVIEPQFVFPAHVSSIRAVACAGDNAKWLCTGGTDETIKVWDMRRRKEVGALIGHEGTITALSFPSRTFMLSASEDGVLNLYRVRDWSLLRTLRGHTGRINSASAHPSGRVALSVGADRMIRMWDLMRGVGASSVKIGVAAERILWDTLGKRFAVMAGRQVMIFATDMTKLGEIEQPKRLHDLAFTRTKMHGGEEHELLCVAGEEGMVHVYDVDDMQPPSDDDDETAVGSPKVLGRLVGHQNRVRSVGVVHVAAEDDTVFLLATTISSDGLIRVFNLTPVTSHDESLDLEAIAEYDTKHSRLTCLSTVGFNPDSGAGDAEDEVEDAPEDEEIASDFDDDEASDEGDENSDEELARLEEEVRMAREAGVKFDEDGGIILEEGDEEEEDDDEDDEDDEDEEEEEDEDEEGDGDDGEEEEEEEEDDEEYDEGEYIQTVPAASVPHHHYGAAPPIPSTVTSAAPVTVLDDMRRREQIPSYSAPTRDSGIEIGSNGYAIEKKAQPSEPLAREGAEEVAHISS